MPLGRLAMHCATLPLFGYAILAEDGMDFAAPKKPAFTSFVYTTHDHALQQLAANAAQLRTVLASSTDEYLAANWPLRFGDHLISDLPRALSYRQMFFNHLIHHTAQLGVYLRLLDIPVPGLFGPSADEPWSPK